MKINYMNTITGEVTENHAEAMEWYRNKIAVKLIDWSEVLGEWVVRGEWIW